MKKMILSVLAVALMAIPAVQAQKVNESALRDKIEKSNADIADAKKGAKASTWLNRGKAFYEAASAPTKDLFMNQMETMMLTLAAGQPTSKGSETLNNVAYETWVYPYFTAYVKDSKVFTWKQTKWVVEDAVSQAIAAYNKAYELDPKSAPKVKEGLQQISDYCSQVGNAGMDAGLYADAATAFAQAFEAQSGPAFGKADPSLLYYAGYLRTVDGSNNPESFAVGADYLNRALELGYLDEEGSIYYFLFHCYYGQREKDKEFLIKGKEALLKGIEKFPKNERILDGLMQLYTSEEGVGDPADLVTLIDGAIAANPENVDLWFGRGRIFYALNDLDESIASFQKVVELKPDLFEGNYYLGVFYAFKGDAMNREANDNSSYSTAEYEAALAETEKVYMAAVPWLEKANEIKPGDINTLELLKKICFRLRDLDGMMDKYNTYNELFLQAQSAAPTAE